MLRATLDAGMREHAEGRFEAAREAYRRALAAAPDHPEAWFLMGTVLLQLGQAQEAAAGLERAARGLRNHPGVLGNLAQAYFVLGRFDDAHGAFRRASRLDPGQVTFQIGAANSLAMQGRRADAESLLRGIAARHPRQALPWFNLGNVLREQQRLPEAADCYARALEIEPGRPDARNNLGSVLHASYRFAEAEQAYRSCLAAAPDYVEARYNLASVLMDVGRFREAEEVCRKIVECDPATALAHTFLGAALAQQGKIAPAVECHRTAAQLAPGDAKIAADHATALGHAGDLANALTEFSRALTLNPDAPGTRYARGTALLAHGRVEEGWGGYLYRPAFTAFREKHPGVQLSRALPPAIDGIPLFLVPEQGLGDELFFLRFAGALSAAGARVVYRATGKIGSLLGRVAGLAQVADESAPAPEGQRVMMIGDLPHALGEYSNQGRPPRFPPPLTLVPLDSRLEAMRQRLVEAGSPPYIGISWRAGTAPRDQRSGADWKLHKEIGIDALGRALRGCAGTFVVLQRHPAPGEIECLAGRLGRHVHDFTDLNEELEGMLALLTLVDDYVGVSNTNMHLRAGAGRTARVLVPCPAEWRWMASGSASPWFPGFTIYRQSMDGDWGPALAALNRDLRNDFGEMSS
jgi:tetratricopeptide (TPR) repeat protein